MTKTELLAKAEAAGWAVLEDTPMKRSDEPPYSRHQLSLCKEVGDILEKKSLDYMKKDTGEIFFIGKDPFAVKEEKVSTTFETKLAEYMATLTMASKVKSDDSCAVVRHFVTDGEGLKEIDSYFTLDSKDKLVIKDVATVSPSI